MRAPGPQATQGGDISSSPSRIRRSGGNAQLRLEEFKSDGNREKKGEKMPSGEATGGDSSSPPTGQAALSSPAPIWAWGFIGMGTGANTGLGSRRCTSGRRGAGGGTGRKGRVVTSRNITNISSVPLLGDVAAPQRRRFGWAGQSRLDGRSIRRGSALLSVALGQRNDLGK